MTVKQFDKIIEVVRNGGVVIVYRYSECCVDCREITENTNIQDIFDYGKENYHFYIKDDDKPLCELEEIM